MVVGPQEPLAIAGRRVVVVGPVVDSGSVALICSRMVMHGVPRCAGDRVCYAWLMKEDVLSSHGVPAIGWSVWADRVKIAMQ